MSSRQIKIAIIVGAMGVALILLRLQFRSQELPGRGKPVVVVCPKGHRYESTWEAIYRMPAKDRYQDLSPGGKTTVRCSSCNEWATVYNPGEEKAAAPQH